MMDLGTTIAAAGRTLDAAARQALEARAAIHWPSALAAFRQLYGERPDLGRWERALAERLVAGAAARPAELRDLDKAREAAPDWFQRPDMLGYSFYVDRFAGTLDGVRRQVPYLRELGVRYLHPLPLLQARPGDSDGGFAVADFRAVEPRLGSMADLSALAAELRGHGISLVLDVVCNHVAREHEWAAKARAGDPHYRAFFHVLPTKAAVDAVEAHLGQVFPQTAPGNFTHDPDMGGWVWTTFYPFQWDLDYGNPAVFIEMLDVLLFLANQGVEAFRLDSVPFLWKRPGTPCRGLPETHLVVRAWRALLAIAAPSVLLKAEAILGLDSVLPFFGEPGAPECQVAYNNAAMTALWAGLALGDARPFQAVLGQARAKPADAAWLTYLRCHDDIIWDALADQVDRAALDRVSDFFAGRVPGSFARGQAFQAAPGGTTSTNGMAASLVGVGGVGDMSAAVARHLMLHAVTLALDGIPTLYMGDELALPNDEGYRQDPQRAADGRWLHRPAMDWQAAGRRHDLGTVEGQVFAALTAMVRLRGNLPAFHAANQAAPVDTGSPAVLGFTRGDGPDRVMCLANLGEQAESLPLPCPGGMRDLLSGEVLPGGSVPLGPWQARWMVGGG